MKILLTGATGYIGKRLLPVLLQQGHEVICSVRERSRFVNPMLEYPVELFEVDFVEPVDMTQAPTDFDVAFFLIHSLGVSIGDFSAQEARIAQHFTDYMNQTKAQQVIYLTGIVNDVHLSEHLESRLAVEKILSTGRAALTALRAGIIVGSGSASFEIIRDLVEKLPVMVAPRWLNTRCQPIGIRNVIEMLTGVMGRPDCYHQNFDIGCEDILTYRDMLLQYAEVRGLRRWIYTVPVMTPRLSSYWLYFVTSTSYPLAVNLVNSMKIDVICRDNRLATLLGVHIYTYKEAVAMAFAKIEQNLIVSSWKDALASSYAGQNLNRFIQVPINGCFVDYKKRTIPSETTTQVLDNIWRIGGQHGWYYGNWLWRFRGFLDKLVGGVGLRRGRTHPTEISAGDALDFWRVLVADRHEKRLLLYAEMKLPGEAWLEFHIQNNELRQTATFRPYGIWGRAYWFAVLPFHYFIFNGMIDRIARAQARASVSQN
ncbi:MAG TPA: SDR family oxidoreductase [Saprospiraceae bacterium]|nr:SDR family oxidoreductase [Saprospiraceae bacterium]HMP23087.1 SDR family oxidoreductase [Saprospiraceae bacterium]